MSIVPNDIDTSLAASRYLHVRMSTEIPSTGRRYPQLMITTDQGAAARATCSRSTACRCTRGSDRCPFENKPPGPERSLIVQPFGGYHELQIELCEQRGWGVSEQCPQANIYGHHAGNYNEEWEQPWLPVPVLGELAGFDRPVRFDVYASTERVYVFLDDQPAGCAVLPAGRHARGRGARSPSAACSITAASTSRSRPTDAGHQYLRRFSLSHFDRHMDDFGIDRDVPAPEWDETVMPCGTRWYGGG